MQKQKRNENGGPDAFTHFMGQLGGVICRLGPFLAFWYCNMDSLTRATMNLILGAIGRSMAIDREVKKY